METEKHYFRVGLYMIVLSVGVALFAMWVMSNGIKNSQEYRIYFSESVSGLSVGSAVKYRGVNVGQVQTIIIDKKNPSLIRVRVELDNTTPVKTDTVASLKMQGITGGVFIELTGSTVASKDLLEVTGPGTIPIIPSESSSINAIVNQLPIIMDKLSKFADQLGKLATDENITKLSDALTNLTAISGDVRQVLHDTKGNVIESTEQLNGTMTNLRRSSRDVSNVTERIKDDPSSLIFPSEEEGIAAP